MLAKVERISWSEDITNFSNPCDTLDKLAGYGQDRDAEDYLLVEGVT